MQYPWILEVLDLPAGPLSARLISMVILDRMMILMRICLLHLKILFNFLNTQMYIQILGFVDIDAEECRLSFTSEYSVFCMTPKT